MTGCQEGASADRAEAGRQNGTEAVRDERSRVSKLEVPLLIGGNGHQPPSLARYNESGYAEVIIRSKRNAMHDDDGYEVELYTHGTASTKSGESAYAYMALNPSGRIVDASAGTGKYANPLDADMAAIEHALKCIKEAGYTSLHVITDSILAEQFLNRKMNIRSRDMADTRDRIHALIKSFEKVTIAYGKDKGLRKKFEEMTAEVFFDS